MTRCKAHDVDFSECNLTAADMRETDFSDARFNRSVLNDGDFADATGYSIDVLENSVAGARFSTPDVFSLLAPFKIIVDDAGHEG